MFHKMFFDLSSVEWEVPNKTGELSAIPLEVLHVAFCLILLLLTWVSKKETDLHLGLTKKLADS